MELTVESPLISAEPALNDRLSVPLPSLSQLERRTSGKRHQFSKADASELGRKGAAARVANIAKTKEALKQAEQLRAKIAAQPDASIYAETRLLRVRGQLDALDEAIQQEVAGGESKRLKELVEAQAKLSEQERILAGRPLPGSHRPTATKPKRSSQEQYGPVD